MFSMKKYLIPILAATLFTAASCGQVGVDKAMVKLFETAAADSAPEEALRRVESQWPVRPYGSDEAETLFDYLTLMAAQAIGEDRVEIIGDGASSELIAEIPGRKNPELVFLICADVTTAADTTGAVVRDDAAAAIASIEVLRLFKSSGLKPGKTVRVVVRQKPAAGAGLAEYVSWSAMRNDRRKNRNRTETNLLQLHLNQCDTLDKHTFYVGEPKPIFEQIENFIPPHFAPYGPYRFVKGPRFVDGGNLPAPYYSYRVSPDEIAKDAAAIASLAYIN